MRKKFLKVKKILKEEGLKKLLILSFRYVRNKTSRLFHPYSEIIFYPYAVAKLKTFKFRDLESLVDFACNFCFGIIKPTQVKEEILELLKILQQHKPKYILEIGTASGGTLFLFCQVAHPEAKIISIDLAGGKFGGGYPKWKIPLYKSFAKDNQKIYLIRGDSHKWSTLKKVEAILDGERLDFLFIDGDHTYKGVKRDFEMYSKLVKRESNSTSRYSLSSTHTRVPSGKVLEGNKRKVQNKRNYIFSKSNLGRHWNNIYINGIVAFHDIVPGSKENVGGVPIFWREIKNNFQYKEIVDNWGQNGYGIGVIYNS